MATADLEAGCASTYTEPLDPPERQRVEAPLEQVEAARLVLGGVRKGVMWCVVHTGIVRPGGRPVQPSRSCRGSIRRREAIEVEAQAHIDRRRKRRPGTAGAVGPARSKGCPQEDPVWCARARVGR